MTADSPPTAHEAAAAITLILVTYNSATIMEWSLPALVDYPNILIVDNHSQDNSVAVVQRLLPQARVIQAGKNLGFGRANNLGLGHVRTPYALLLNPDSLLDAGALDALHRAALRYPQAAIVAPVLYDAPGIVGDFFRGPFFAKTSKVAPEPTGDLCTEFVTGAAMLLNMTAMRQVGFFDPWFFLYFEDDDLCLRTRRAGYQIMVAHEARIEHRTRQSSRPSWRTTLRRTYCMTLSKFYITRKYFGAVRCAGMVLRIGAGGLLSLPLALVLFRNERVMRHAARMAAALLAWRHLRRQHCFEPVD